MDIIILAAITCFIFLKLKKHLGQIDEVEKQQIEERVAKRKAEIFAIQNQVLDKKDAMMRCINPATNPDSKDKAHTQMQVIDSEEQAILDSLDDSTKQNFLSILQSCKIDAKFFINGARSAFEMVLKAFAEGDLETLKLLLSVKIYQGFEGVVNQRKANSEALVTNLIAIEKSEIISASSLASLASITVRFTSKQINYLSNGAGEITQGVKNEIKEVSDVWTFMRDVSSTSPNWFVSATQ